MGAPATAPRRAPAPSRAPGRRSQARPAARPQKPGPKRTGAKRAPGPKRTAARTPRPRTAARPHPRAFAQPALAGAALIPQAAVGAVGAVRDISDSSLIVRLTRGRGWIGVLCALLAGIVTLNVFSLSISTTSGRVTQQISELERSNSALRAALADELSASRVEETAAEMGLYTPAGDEFIYLDQSEDDLDKLVSLLENDTVLTDDTPVEVYAPEEAATEVITPASAPVTEAVEPAAEPVAPVSPTRLPPPHRRAPAPPEGSGSSPGSVVRQIDRRLGLLFCVFLAIFSLALVRAAWLQGIKGGELQAEARTQQVTTVKVPGERGRVLDRNGKVLAVSEDAATVIATPYQVVDPAGTAEKLADILPVTRTEVEEKLSSGTGFEYLAHKVDLDEADEIEDLEIEGIDTLPDSRRNYPQGELAAQVIGAVGSENEGLDRPGAGRGRHARRLRRRAGGRPRRPRQPDPLRHGQAGQRRGRHPADDRRSDSGPRRGGDRGRRPSATAPRARRRS